jgi:DNA polymerase III delta subunit
MLIPMLQSGSIFGDLQGLELIDAQNLNAAEGSLLAELLPHTNPGAVAIALVSFGSLPAQLSKTVKALAETVSLKKQYERQAGEWLAEEIRRRRTVVDESGTAALLQRFGSDTAAMGQALDQLSAFPGKITRDVVLDRFRNRPDEPTFHYTDAVAAGRVGEALRRLADFLTHSHPLILIAALESDLRRRALASAAPDQQTFYQWIGATASDRRPERLWRDRGRVADSSLRKALDALVRADRILKTQPEDLHQVTLERLTVALARWYGK